MNPLAIIAVAASAVMGFGLMLVSDPETDTAGLVSESTVYTAPLSGTVGLDSPPQASTGDMSVVTTLPPYTGPGCQEWADTALRGGFVLDDLWIALQVAELESGCTELFDPLTNMWVAWHIATKYGWENWSTYDRVVG
jgi:hypothetical protein